MSEARFKNMRHIETVRNYLGACIRELMHKQERHDQTKLESPEVEAYDAITHPLRGLTYGSDEYRAILKAQALAIQHHYHFNRHHPEFFPDGVLGMTLLDLVEMVCDWKAATLRHGDGDIYKSLEINQARFGYGAALHRILTNTVDWLETQPVYHKADES
jgi:hypothetical protein